MKKPLLAVYSTMILLSLALVLIVGCAPAKSPDMTIIFETYGGFVLPDMAKQVFSITPQHILYSTYNARGEMTSLIEKNLTRELYDNYISVFIKNDYLSFKDSYTGLPMNNSGSAKLTIVSGRNPKVIIIDPYNLTILPDKVKNVVEALQADINELYTTSEQDLKGGSEKFITDSPTYKVDGSGLTFLGLVTQDTFPPKYILTYNFTAAEGYGDRSKIAGPRLLTQHQIVITISQRKIISAIIDNKWDELHQRMLGDYNIMYQPLQCVDAPWRKWYNATSPDKKTSEEEMLVTFYAANYQILVTDFKIVYPDNPVVAICGNNESYHITASVSNTYVNEMLKLGWKELK